MIYAVKCPKNRVRYRVGILDRRKRILYRIGEVPVEDAIKVSPLLEPAGELVGRIEGLSVDGVSQAPGECVQAVPGRRVRLSGWGLDLRLRRPGGAVALKAPGGKRVFAGYGYRRSDVAIFFGSPSVLYSGWAVEVAGEALAKDGERTEIELWSGDGRRKITVGDGLKSCAGGTSR